MPDTTPMAKETAKILVQKRARRWNTSLPVFSQISSSVAMKADRPMVKAGKMTWKETVKANCMRARVTGSKSMASAPGNPGRAARHPAADGCDATCRMQVGP